MMQTILKYEIPVYTEDHAEVRMHPGAHVLSVGTQMVGGLEGIFLWAIVDERDAKLPPQEWELRKLVVVGTGHMIPPDVDTERFLGTVHFKSKPLVFHIFEAKS